jgi:hypothetical protein
VNRAIVVGLPIYFVKFHKPVAETQNLFKQVEEAAFKVFEHVSCNRLGIDSQEYWQNENC